MLFSPEDPNFLFFPASQSLQVDSGQLHNHHHHENHLNQPHQPGRHAGQRLHAPGRLLFVLFHRLSGHHFRYQSRFLRNRHQRQKIRREQSTP